MLSAIAGPRIEPPFRQIDQAPQGGPCAYAETPARLPRRSDVLCDGRRMRAAPATAGLRMRCAKRLGLAPADASPSPSSDGTATFM